VKSCKVHARGCSSAATAPSISLSRAPAGQTMDPSHVPHPIRFSGRRPPTPHPGARRRHHVAERTSKRGISRILFLSRGAAISLRRPLPGASIGPPEGHTSRASSSPLLGLSPDGVCRAGMVTHPAGGLLPHRFTLTDRVKGPAVCFLWHFPWPRGRWALPTVLPCGVRTFLILPTRMPTGRDRLPHFDYCTNDYTTSMAGRPVTNCFPWISARHPGRVRPPVGSPRAERGGTSRTGSPPEAGESTAAAAGDGGREPCIHPGTGG